MTDSEFSLAKDQSETEHELPCGHVLPTASLLDRITHFSSAHLRGAVDCPVCEKGCNVEFARMTAASGSVEWPVTFVSTGEIDGGPGAYFVAHQRRRVPGLVVDGSVARLGLREWQLSSR